MHFDGIICTQAEVSAFEKHAHILLVVNDLSSAFEKDAHILMVMNDLSVHSLDSLPARPFDGLYASCTTSMHHDLRLLSV